jgi:preprotein translocase subunit SecF
LLSAFVILSGLISIVTFGFRYSIDFVGGTNIEYSISQPVSKNAVKKIIDGEKIEYSTLTITKTGLFLKSKPLDEQRELRLRTRLQKELPVKVAILRFETVGPVLGRETLQKTLIASLLATFGILVYMSFAFKGFTFAVAAILAMIHDFLVVIGTYSIFSRFFGAELDTMFVTAVLTTMSFSVHDTIVIFDKIREYFKYEGRGDIRQLANKALTETMVRSLNNSMTIIFMLLALTLMGGTTIRFFVLTLLVGTITGTYSSPFIATPILVWLEQKRKKS